MKLLIKSSEQAAQDRANRSSRDKAVIDVMSQSFDVQDEPEVGLFWYDPDSQELVGVTSSVASTLPWSHSKLCSNGIKTDSRLHRAVRNKQVKRSPNIFGEYIDMPRGRVFEFKDEGFKVYVGDWIDDCPEAVDLILEEFSLPADTEFIKDVHWDIGHGWSDEF